MVKYLCGKLGGLREHEVPWELRRLFRFISKQACQVKLLSATAIPRLPQWQTQSSKKFQVLSYYLYYDSPGILPNQTFFTLGISEIYMRNNNKKNTSVVMR